MSELFLRADDGKEIPLKKVEGLDGNGTLVVTSLAHFRKTDIEMMEAELSNKFERKVVILDGKFESVLALKE